ncbi:MAG: helix-turn-helix domain-containing protein, partial [Candidatus Caldatribacteriota bacterium]|nr:helix-turn-helix domain-containing protein [Candidatus Caldatribacteriota bacterium]
MQQAQCKKENELDDCGFTMLPNNFLKTWAKTLGKGPLLLYLQLCTYCHQDNYIAWPALKTLGNDLGMAKNSIISYQKILLQNGLIQKIRRRKSNGNYHSNLYQLTPMAKAKNGPDGVQKLYLPSPNIAPDQVQNLHPNNTNTNNTNITTTKIGEDVVVNFKKIKEKGEEKMKRIRERMRDLDLTESFTEKVLADYPLKKVEEKLELYARGRQVRNPVGWLMAALK